MDFPHRIDWIDGLVDKGKPVLDSVTRTRFLFVYDGGIERVELDLLFDMVVDWTCDLLWF